MALTHSTFEELFDAIADAIREQEGSSATIIADNFPTRIRSLTPTGAGLDTSDATATASDIASGITAYVNGVKITGTIDTIEDGEDSGSDGAGVQQTGSVLQLYSTLAINRLFRPGSRVVLGTPLSTLGNVTASDVISGQTFTSSAGLNQTGSFTIDTEISTQESLITQIQTALEGKGSGINTSDATATAADIGSGYTAYINGEKVTGTFTIDNEITTQESLILNIQNALIEKIG